MKRYFAKTDNSSFIHRSHVTCFPGCRGSWKNPYSGELCNKTVSSWLLRHRSASRYTAEYDKPARTQQKGRQTDRYKERRWCLEYTVGLQYSCYLLILSVDCQFGGDCVHLSNVMLKVMFTRAYLYGIIHVCDTCCNYVYTCVPVRNTAMHV